MMATTTQLSGRFLTKQYNSPLLKRNKTLQTTPSTFLLFFQSFTTTTSSTSSLSTLQKNKKEEKENKLFRLSKLLSQHATNLPPLLSSRRSIERLIQNNQITLGGSVITNPAALVSLQDVQKNALSFNHQLILFDFNIKNKKNSNNNVKKPRIWLAHKLKSELVSHTDPHNRPALLQRLRAGGVAPTLNLKPIGRLDMNTEGLILLTTCGSYAREMELPSNQFHRTYRVRVHGLLTGGKLDRMRKGNIKIDGVLYKPMQVSLETTGAAGSEKNGSRMRMRKRKQGRKKVPGGGTNHWLRITCTEGKNRQIRRVMEYLGLNVTRLIRISYGDYDLNTIPPGMAIEVPIKPIETQKRRGRKKNNINNVIRAPKRNNTNHDKRMDVSGFKEEKKEEEGMAPPVEWIKHA